MISPTFAHEGEHVSEESHTPGPEVTTIQFGPTATFLTSIILGLIFVIGVFTILYHFSKRKP